MICACCPHNTDDRDGTPVKAHGITVRAHWMRPLTLCMIGLALFWLSGVSNAWSGATALLATYEGGEGGPIISFNREVERRVRQLLDLAGFRYPLEHGFAVLVFKEEQRMELWAYDRAEPRLVKTYPVTAMSGQGGPKRRRGDHQVPEGIYQIVWLNPNSNFHLSLKLDYPNAFDLMMAEEDGRTNLGGDIFIHGGASSVGCVAVGDAAIEELFVLTLMAGDGPIEVIIAPYDFRQQPERPSQKGDPAWLPVLYQEIASRLTRYTVSVANDPSSGLSSQAMITNGEKR